MLRALRFEILRNIKSDGRIKIPLSGVPVRVATLINEELFNEEQLLVHNRTVFLEDRVHDWHLTSQGDFSYFSRVADRADVLIVYELDSQYVPRPRFCPNTGKPLDPQS